MDAIMNSTNSSNSLPLVKNGKCEGCSETTRDSEVLHCYLCKNVFHVMNCTVTETLQPDALPSNTNLANFIKFSAKSYPSGTFIWTCFRCGVIKQLTSNDNIDQRVALLESLLITLSPTLSALAKSVDNGNAQDIAKLVSDIRASTPVASIGNPSLNTPASSEVVPHHADVSCSSQPTAELTPQMGYGKSMMLIDSNHMPAIGLVDHKSCPDSAGVKTKKIKIRVTSKNEADPLRSRFHRAHSTGKIGSYSIRYHSNNRADVLLDSISDAEAAYDCLTAELEDIEVSYPTYMNTKMVHIVGLTEDDSKDSVYKAICQPGRNRAIEHLVNPYTLRVLDIKPCNRNRHLYRASVVISEEIWDIILNKMNKKLQIDYLSCSVFLRPISIRCYRCQRLGHSAQSCKEDITCVVCGGGHYSKQCTNTPNCINCSGLALDSDHRADSPDCTAYKNFQRGSAKK